MSQNATIFLLVIVIALAMAREFSGKKQRVKKEYQYKEKKFFLSPVEHKFYDALIASMGAEYRVFAQVHLPTIVDNKIPGQSWHGSFRHIDEKSVDFVLCDKAYISPKLIIELDDSSHLRSDRQARDTEVERILKMAGLPLLRLKAQPEFSVSVIQSQVRQALLQHQVPVTPPS